MKSQLRILSSLVICALIASGVSAKTKRKSQGVVPDGVATSLPAMKPKKHVAVDFQENDAPVDDAVVIRETPKAGIPADLPPVPPAVTEELNEISATTKTKTVVTAKPKPIAVKAAPTPAPLLVTVPAIVKATPAPTPMPTPLPIVVATPTPQPTPTLPPAESFATIETKAAPVPSQEPATSPAPFSSSLEISRARSAAPSDADIDFDSTPAEPVVGATPTPPTHLEGDSVPPFRAAPQATAERREDEHTTNALVTQVTSSAPTRSNQHSLFIRTSYLDAHYDQLDSRLKNGATAWGVGYRHKALGLEFGAALDLVHGLDQEVSLQNTRMILARAEVRSFFLSELHELRPYVGGSLGLANVDVFSYRSVNGDDITIREHAKGTAIAASPAIGARYQPPGLDFFADLSLEYLLLAGANDLQKTGGTLFGLSLGSGF